MPELVVLASDTLYMRYRNICIKKFDVLLLIFEKMVPLLG